MRRWDPRTTTCSMVGFALLMATFAASVLPQSHAVGLLFKRLSSAAAVLPLLQIMLGLLPWVITGVRVVTVCHM